MELAAPMGRILSLDRFRGLCLALMLAFGASKMFASASSFFVPLSTHDLSKSFQLIAGYGFYDVIAPMFIFASGLSFGVSYRAKLERFGYRETRKSCLMHAFQIIGLGGLLVFNTDDVIGIILLVLMILALVAKVISFFPFKFADKISPFLRKFLFYLGILLTVWNVVQIILFAVDAPSFSHHWGPLCSIGIGMLICLLWVEFRPWQKILMSTLCASFYASLCFVLPASLFMGFTHGGLLGSLGYALLYVFAETLFSLRKQRFAATAYVLLAAIAALVLTWYITPSKEAVNITYVLWSLVISFSVYSVISHLDSLQIKRFPILASLGKYSLTLYCMHFLVSNMYGICVCALVKYLNVPQILATITLALGLILYLILATIAIRAMAKRNWVIRL